MILNHRSEQSGTVSCLRELDHPYFLDCGGYERFDPLTQHVFHITPLHPAGER